MSILLDALRKSENSQKPVEPPTIHGNDHHMDAPSSIKSSYVILLVLIALIVIGWLLWQQYHGEEGGYTPPVGLPTGKTTNKVPEVPGTTRSAPAASAQQEPVATDTGQANSAPAKATAAPRTAATNDNRPRTPVEVFEMTTKAHNAMSQEDKDAEKTMRRTRAAEIRAQRAADKRAAEARLNRAPAQPVSPPPSSANTRNANVARPPVAANEAMTDAQRQNSDASTEEYRSPEPEPIGYWELPDSVRRGVPEIKFSVLVYADNPANRFVLINGERLVEGDDLKAGVEVEQIRRDGVIFSYQMYQFFVKR